MKLKSVQTLLVLLLTLSLLGCVNKGITHSEGCPKGCRVCDNSSKLCEVWQDGLFVDEVFMEHSTYCVEGRDDAPSCKCVLSRETSDEKPELECH